MKLPRILLAAGGSGSGKTLITCGILQALCNRGKRAASFKCGPDYIDPMFHSRVIGTKSRNLDTFFVSRETAAKLLAKNGAGCDIAVMEGVMGFYDGLAGISDRASAWDVADATDTPVILIVNSRGMSRSVCAYIKGFLDYKENSHIRGVIFNRMSPMLYPRIKELAEKELGVKVLGYVPEVKDCCLESRHLGLVLPDEIPALKDRLMLLAETLEKTLDLDGILSLAETAASLPTKALPSFPHEGEALRIGVARDEAFCFMYEDNLELLKEMGAKLIFFSPVHDKGLPENLDGMLLYGGYPELFAKNLQENSAMREAVKTSLKGGMPCMAECGGFMYLHEALTDMDGETYTMAGVLPGRTFWTGRLGRFGYVTLKRQDGLYGEETGEIPAHEFHYFDSTGCGESFLAQKPLSSRTWSCIRDDGRLFAGFPHLYYYGNPQVPQMFLKRCLAYKKERT